MADYDPSNDLLPGGVLDADAISDELKKLACLFNTNFDSTDKSTASSGTLRTNSVAVEADEIVLVIGYVNWSGDNLGDEAIFQLTADASVIDGGNYSEFVEVANSSGRYDSVTIIALHEPSAAGTVVYDLDWTVTGSGTIYSESQRLQTLVFKKRS